MATAEELLRSRYSAYATGEVDYICATQVGGDKEGIEGWSRSATFRQLRILAQQGDDQTAVIDFEADYESGGQAHTHRERSSFEHRDGKWMFIKGQGIPVVSGHAKVGRNDPCPCGSGKKHKKCCAS